MQGLVKSGPGREARAGHICCYSQGTRKATEYVGFLKGSFIFSLRFKFSDDGPDAIIRFPKLGHTATTLCNEKVTNEVQAMDYLTEHTTIPIPRIYSWGLTTDSPHQLGPFIIMDFVTGILLSKVLKQPTESEQDAHVLDPNIDDAKLNKIYGQIADYLLQLSKLALPRIGAITKEGDGWSVTQRPLTYNMNELATVTGCSDDIFPTCIFDSVTGYLESVAHQHLAHLRTQRNIADDPTIARARFIARHCILQLIPKYSIQDAGPFIPFCDDLRPSDMLVDPETLEITAVLDLEFTNAMPAQFSYDPPSWLLLSGPEFWLDRGALGEFRDLYVPKMEQFLRGLDELEAREDPEARHPGEPLLSARMRDSWSSGRFWFDYAVRKSFDMDVVYWAALHDQGDGIDYLYEETRGELGPFVDEKMGQLWEYRRECAALFSSTSG